MGRYGKAKRLWGVYNNQEKYNTAWANLFAYLSFLILKKATTNTHKNHANIKKSTKTNSRKIRIYLEEHLIYTYKNAWNEACQILKCDLDMPSEEAIRSIVNETWVGSINFKARQVRNTNIFLNKLKKIMEDKKMSESEKLIAKKKLIKHYKYTVYRLTRTETARVINTAAIQAYEKANIKFVEWVTAEDEKVCKICAPRDRKIYSISLAPTCPDHPNCRCVLIPRR